MKGLVTRRPKVVTGPTEIVEADRAVWEQHRRIGGNLTPYDVACIVLEADQGGIYRAMELAQEARAKDGHLHSALRAREQWLSELPYVVEPYNDDPGKDPLPEDVETADLVRSAIDNAVGDGDEIGSFADLVECMQGGIYLGHSTDETIWEYDGRYILPCGWCHIDQRRFAFRYKDGRLIYNPTSGIGLGGARFGNVGVDLRREFPGQYVCHQPREFGDIPIREGLWHLLIWPALFRNWSISDWMKLAELAWKPWRLGKLKKDAGKRDRDNLLEMLRYLTTAGIGIYNEEKAELDIRWPEGMAAGGRGKSAHQALCEFMGQEISKAVRGTTLTSEAGDRGARSLGDVHVEQERTLRNADARSVNTTIRQHIIAPIVYMNRGPDAKLPKSYFATEDSVDVNEFADGIGKLKKAGLKIPAAHVYDVTGIPTPAKGETLLGEDEEDVDVSEFDETANEDEPPTTDEESEPEPDDDSTEE